jgi:hypothetical protein
VSQRLSLEKRRCTGEKCTGTTLMIIPHKYEVLPLTIDVFLSGCSRKVIKMYLGSHCFFCVSRFHHSLFLSVFYHSYNQSHSEMTFYLRSVIFCRAGVHVLSSEGNYAFALCTLDINLLIFCRRYWFCSTRYTEPRQG